MLYFIVLYWNFISPGGHLIALVKPQFEAEKHEVDIGRGIIRDEVIHNRILTNIKKCRLLPIYIYDINNNHLISLVIDNNKKLISIFNTTLQENNIYYKKIIKLFNLNYKFIFNDDNIKCDSYKKLCVPLSLLMIYCYFNKINMHDFLKYINKISVESSYNLIDNFINYLEN